MQTLGERIRELREREDLSLRELARKCDVSPAFLSDVELGRRHPSAKVLDKLARALGTSSEELREHDVRAPLQELQRLTRNNPRFALAFRRVLDREVSPEEIEKLAKGKPNRRKS